jgi:glycosyltransferase involved in cell wall biosynthesis
MLGTDTAGPYRPLSEWGERRRLLIFIQADCPHSRKLLPVIAGLHPDPPPGIAAPMVIAGGEAHDLRHLIATHRIRCPVLLQDDFEVASLYGVRRTPAACLLGPDGRVLGRVRTGAIGVLNLARLMPGPDWTAASTELRSSGGWYYAHIAPSVRQALREQMPTPQPLDRRPDGALPLVSVIITTRDRPGLLPITLECYRRQTYPRRELIVVDDGAEFPVSAQQIAELGGRLIRVPEGTPYGAKINRGASESRGALCQLWDDDDWYDPHFLETLVFTYLRHRETVCRPTITYQIRRRWFDLAQWRVLDWPNDDPSGGTLLFGRDDWEEHPFRELRTSTEYWFIKDQVQAGAAPAPVDAAELYIYVRHNTAAGGRGNVWTHWMDGQTLEEYLRPQYGEVRDPAAIFPDWALAAYSRLRGGAGPATPASNGSTRIASAGTPPAPVVAGAELRLLGAEAHAPSAYRSLSEWRGRPALLIFIQPDCPHSRELFPAIAGMSSNPAGAAPVPILVASGPEGDVREIVEGFGIRCPVLMQDDAEAAALFGIRSTPAAFLLDRHGRMAGKPVQGAAQVFRLMGVAQGPVWTDATTKWRDAGDYLQDLLGRLGPVDPAEIQAEMSELRAKDGPLVSVIVCTRDRPRFLALALECYRRQTYPWRELIVVDNGTAFPADRETIAAAGGQLIPVPAETPLGAMLNQGISHARGWLCQKWDDDDWYAPEFLATQVAACVARSRATGHSAIVYMNRASELDLARWRVRESNAELPWGSTLLFPRDAWANHPFPESRRSEDYWFIVDQLRSGSVEAPVRAGRLYVCVKHDVFTGERPHTHREPAEQQPPDAEAAGELDPAKALPDWALSVYGELRPPGRLSLSAD